MLVAAVCAQLLVYAFLATTLLPLVLPHPAAINPAGQMQLEVCRICSSRGQKSMGKPVVSWDPRRTLVKMMLGVLVISLSFGEER